MAKSKKARKPKPAGLPTTAGGRALYALRVTDPDLYRTRIRDALAAAGSIGGAAEKLGVLRRQLERAVEADPSLRDGIPLPSRGKPKKPQNAAGKRGVVNASTKMAGAS